MLFSMFIKIPYARYAYNVESVFLIFLIDKFLELETKIQTTKFWHQWPMI